MGKEIVVNLLVEQHTYAAVFTPEDEGGFSVSVPELPGCFTQGETLEEAIEMAQEAISVYIECDETGQNINYK